MTKRPHGIVAPALALLCAIPFLMPANAAETPATAAPEAAASPDTDSPDSSAAPAPAASPVAAGSAASGATHVDHYRINTYHTGFIDAKLRPPLSILWRRSTEALSGATTTGTTSASSGALDLSSPVYANKVVYFAAGKHVYAVNADNGGVAWKYPATDDDADVYRSTPALDSGALYIGNDGSELVKLDMKTGKKLWSCKTEGPVRTPPVVTSGVVYFGCEDLNFYAVNAETGKKIWKYAVDSGIVTSATMAGSTVVFGTSDNTLFALNSSTGRRIWQAQINSDPRTSPPVFAENLIVGSGTQLVAMSIRNGSVRWSKPLSSEVCAPVTVGAGSIYAASQDQQIAAFTDRGRQRWTKTLAYPATGAPLLTSDALLVATQRGIIYALDPQSGDVKWEYVMVPTGTPKARAKAFANVRCAPIVADGTLYVLSDDGVMTAFRPDSADSVPPRIVAYRPASNTRVGGVRIPYAVTLVDDGSGINPDSISLKVDGVAVKDVVYDPTTNAVHMDPKIEQSAVVTSTLSDGSHEAVLSATDWRGNTVTHSWGFRVDNALNPKGIKILSPDDIPQAEQAPPPPPRRGVNRTQPAQPVNPPPPGASDPNGAPPPPPPFPAP
jgi:outer membrane protein assembly factor BamB